MALGRTVRSDPFYLRVVRSVVFPMVDGLADHRLLSFGAGGGWIFQTCFLLQICLPDWTVQFCGVDAIAVRSESARAGCLHPLPYQGLHSRPAGTGDRSGDDPGLRAGPVSAQ